MEDNEDLDKNENKNESHIKCHFYLSQFLSEIECDNACRQKVGKGLKNTCLEPHAQTYKPRSYRQ